ncbi:MAG: hypothetical protein FJ100_07320 [Deltaproteobacteria bacterium]|nr:hypothetical protein [Deltaproteobacteria bacterium]
MTRPLALFACAAAATACLSGGGSGGGSGPFTPIDGAAPGGDASTRADAPATPETQSAADAPGVDSGGPDAAAPDATKQDAAQPPPAGSHTVAACPDGAFAEPTPADPKASLATLTAGYKSTEAIAFVEAALGVRYPVGKTLLVEGKKVKMGGGKNCVDAFFQATKAGSASAALGQASTLVHECGHLYDLGQSGFSGHLYWLNEAAQFTCAGLAYQGANKGFARSLIKGDGFDATWPACASFGMSGCDGYAPIYLGGDPKDPKFDSGDQGYDMLLEEVAQYVNSLAVDYAFADHSQFSTSAEDGILTFLWYMTRYLHLARTQHPAVYTYLSGNPCWRQATLSIWGRAWLYLDKTKGNAKLNLKGAMLRQLVDHPDLLDEIQRLRQIEGCL